MYEIRTTDVCTKGTQDLIDLSSAAFPNLKTVVAAVLVGCKFNQAMQLRTGSRVAMANLSSTGQESIPAAHLPLFAPLSNV